MRWGCQRNNQRSPKTLLFVFRRFACRSAALLSVWSGQPVFEVGVVGTDEDGGIFLVKLDFGGLFLLGRSCSHRLILSAALSRNRVFFGDFLRLLTWEKWRIGCNLAQLRNIKYGKTRTAGDQNTFCRFTSNKMSIVF